MHLAGVVMSWHSSTQMQQIARSYFTVYCTSCMMLADVKPLVDNLPVCLFYYLDFATPQVLLKTAQCHNAWCNLCC